MAGRQADATLTLETEARSPRRALPGPPSPSSASDAPVHDRVLVARDQEFHPVPFGNSSLLVRLRICIR
jgi:hypothetical protein